MLLWPGTQYSCVVLSRENRGETRDKSQESSALAQPEVIRVRRLGSLGERRFVTDCVGWMGRLCATGSCVMELGACCGYIGTVVLEHYLHMYRLVRRWTVDARKCWCFLSEGFVRISRQGLGILGGGGKSVWNTTVHVEYVLCTYIICILNSV